MSNLSVQSSIRSSFCEPVDYQTGDASEEQNWKAVPTQWAASGNSYSAVPSTVKTLPAGLYEVMTNDHGQVFFAKKTINVDSLIDFPESLYHDVIDEINDFWKRDAEFKKHGFLHRRGYLLHGPTGSGKTCLVHQIMRSVIQSNGVVLVCHNPSVLRLGLGEFRKIEFKRKLVCLFEDIDAMIDGSRGNSEEELLNILDGENQVDHVLNVATTNYPDKLDKRLTGRPRRFDRIIYIDNPGPETRRIFFEKKLRIADSELDKWVKATDDFSFASCSELCVSVKCLGNGFVETINLLRQMQKDFVESGTGKLSVGFARNDAPLLKKPRLPGRRKA